MPPEKLTVRKATVADAATVADLARLLFIESYGSWFKGSRAPEPSDTRGRPLEELTRQFRIDEEETKDFLDYVESTFLESRFAKRIGDPETKAAVILAEVEGEAVGLIELDTESAAPASVKAARAVEIVRFYVAPRWRGQGVASALVRSAEAEAGVGTLWAGVWDGNARALAFFKKHWFRSLASRESFMGRGLRFDAVLVQDVAIRAAPPVATIRPRIFISHSAKDHLAGTRLLAMEEELRKENFDVFVDRLRLQPGAVWRNELYTAMGRSHGAIIFFSGAAAQSQWVRNESAYLSIRGSLNPQFRLLPVFLDEDERVLRSPEFEPLDLGRLQVIKNVLPDSALKEIVTFFQPLKQSASDAPLDLLINTIVPHLPSEQFLLERAAQELGIDFTTADPSALAPEIARALFHAGLQTLYTVLTHLSAAMTRSAALEVINVVVPFWVDPKAVAPLARAAMRSRGIVPMINAATDITARMYIRRAASKHPLLWVIIPVTAAGGERTASAIIGEVRDLFRRTDPELESFDDAAIDRRIAGAAKIEPVIILMPPDVRAATIREVRAKFPDCTVFIRCGETVPPRERYLGLDVVVLTPELTADLENEMTDLYLACRRIAQNLR